MGDQDFEIYSDDVEIKDQMMLLGWMKRLNMMMR